MKNIRNKVELKDIGKVLNHRARDHKDSFWSYKLITYWDRKMNLVKAENNSMKSMKPYSHTTT